MKNILLISPDFPYTYYQFAKAFKANGVNVLAIGGTPYDQLHPELKSSLNKYYCCCNMENIDDMKKIVGWLIDEFGPIDFLESNNEYWLRNDSILRETFNITSGLFPSQLDDFQRKSSMKKYFESAKAKVAPYLLVKDFDSLKNFAEKYGYPLFVKPDIGVGAGGNYKIRNFEELSRFYTEKEANVQYICEVFVDATNIITFDGIVDENSEAVVCCSMVCPASIFEIKEKNEDMFYYDKIDVDPKLEKLGKKVIKCMGLKNRFFHTEYFVAANDCPGWFKKGDYIGIEVNIRTPGGYTPDMQDFALSTNVYQMFADVICFGKTNLTVGERFYCATASRRNRYSYFFNEEDILRTYANNICFHGDYPFILSDIMGDKFYMAKFKTLEETLLYRDYLNKRTDTATKSEYSLHHVLGEDQRMMREKNSGSDLSEMSICDKHIDGA